jgi:hypothetical protein
MPGPSLDTIIASALASGQPTEYEATPENFGPATNRWFLREFLSALALRHRTLEISLFGSPPSLARFGLVAGEALDAGTLQIPVARGPTKKAGALRFVFTAVPVAS